MIIQNKWWSWFGAVLVVVSVPSGVGAFAEDSPSARIKGFVLLNADTGEEIRALVDGDTILLRSLPTKNITIRADTVPERVSRVVFRLDQFQRFREETRLPYALAGDLHGRYLPWKAKVGKHVMEAIPYQGAEEGLSQRVSFSIIEHNEEVAIEVGSPESLPGDTETDTSKITLSEPEEEVVAPLEEKESVEITPTPMPTGTPLPREVATPEATPTEEPSPTPSPTASPLPTKAPTPTQQPNQNQGIIDKMAFELSAARVVPPSNSTAFGRCLGSFDRALGELTLGCTHTIIGPMSAAVMRGQTGNEGPPVCSLGVGESPIAATCLLSPENAAELLKGELYIEVRSVAYAGGDLRGQIRDEVVKGK